MRAALLRGARPAACVQYIEAETRAAVRACVQGPRWPRRGLRRLSFRRRRASQGLATLATFEGTWQGSAELHISEAARTALGACVDAMGRCCGDTARVTLMRQMALLAPISDHAFMLPVCRRRVWRRFATPQ